MATPGQGVRSTRKLRQWTVEQVESGKFRGLEWDDAPAKTMFRIPWKHAGKQEFRHEEDAAFFKEWAIFKGKYRLGERLDPAAWKTRVRCALAKSPEFEEVPSRSRLDITEPYKVYRLVPLSEQRKGNSSKKSRKMKLEDSSGTSEEGGRSPLRSVSQVTSFLLPNMDGSSTLEDPASPSLNAAAVLVIRKEEGSPQPGEPAPDMMEAALCLKAETVLAETPEVMKIGEFSIQMSVFYSGVLVSSLWLPQGDFLITSVTPPLRAPSNRMRRVVLPHPDKVEDPEKQKAILQLLKELEKGVMADSNQEGIFVQCQRKCKAKVCWQGLTDSQAAGKLDSDTFLHVFSAKTFQSAWSQYVLGLASKPEHQVTLCIGEELEGNDSLNNKLIIIQMAQNFAARMTEVKQMQDLDPFVLPFELLHPSA